MSYLRYLYLLAYTGVCFVLFVFVLCLVYPVLPVSLDYLYCYCPSVFSNVYLFQERVMCTKLDIYVLFMDLHNTRAELYLCIFS